jgi:DNA (cytosine-5)-methyltransferase 1
MGSIPVVDLFAGPGGLGEGLSSYRTPNGSKVFEIRVSVERDEWAHATLRLRSLFRALDSGHAKYWKALEASGGDWTVMSAVDARAAKRAEQEAIRLELGPATAPLVRGIVDERITRTKPWVLVGGPPCQAYSLVGRSRNRGNPRYVPEADPRQTLYLEYLQILGDHAPTVFVMENVKGLLSAQLARESIFNRICTDLRKPGDALRRNGRSSRLRPEYELFALAPRPARGGPMDLFPESLAPEPHDFVVRSEEFGIPQARHRVIIVGVDRGCLPAVSRLVACGRGPTVRDAISGLPRLRSGLSGSVDSPREWMSVLQSAVHSKWFIQADTEVRDSIRSTVEHLTAPRHDRGADVLRLSSGDRVLNHSARGHMREDLHRYLFASAFARETKSTPVLSDFPTALRPKHRNVEAALQSGHFSDRFRVQLSHRPATTITSHIAKDGHYYIHYDPRQCRSLTVREAAALQTFPCDYYFCGPRTEQYRQVGNAVPPRLAEQIAGVIHSIIG